MSDANKDQKDVDTYLDLTLEQRADYIQIDKLRNETAQGDWFDVIHEALIDRGTKLLVGPRGCGKTHVMRFAWDTCISDEKLPLAVYVSFNRYYRLEPLLRAKSNAIDLFHVWVLANIMLGLFETLEVVVSRSPLLYSGEVQNLEDILSLSKKELTALIVKLERSLPLTTEEEKTVENVSIDQIKQSINSALEYVGRKRAILLLDDAALTLTPEYMGEFFDTVRALKTTRIAFKASVYPGTTEYGPRFHALQEGNLLQLWLTVDDLQYSDVMESIARAKMPNFDEVPSEVSELLKYAAFGIPRAYLAMLAEYVHETGGTSQRNLNKIIQSHAAARFEEYRSLAKKVPRFSTLIERGESMFRGVVRDLKVANDDLQAKDEKQLLLGVQAGEEEQPLVRRLFNLLIEAGMLYEHPQVSHGLDRTYTRYTPHLAILLDARVFAGRDRGTSAVQTISFLKRKPTKHPLRRSITTLFAKDDLANLTLDLPACNRCGTARLSDQQRFCHHCGAELLDQSTFYKCMSIPITDIPGLTSWQLERIKTTLPNFHSIGDVLAHQDPGTELRKIHMVGQRRAENMLAAITVFIEEFLS